MPSGQPFTQLCQLLGRPRHFGRVDLHVHSTASDGSYTPAQVVELARRSGLSAVALTDHDTIAGIAAARQAACGTGVEVCVGVELTAEYRGKELHLLGYGFDVAHAPLVQALERLRQDRVGRYEAMAETLRGLGVPVPAAQCGPRSGTLGRRHLAELVVRVGKAATVREAFQRYLHDRGPAAVPKTRLPVGEAITLVRDADGVAAWAHPSYDCAAGTLAELKDLGLKAIEASFPAARPSRQRELRELAASLGLAVTGGSDCHGPGEPSRALGACSIAHAEYLRIKELTSG